MHSLVARKHLRNIELKVGDGKFDTAVFRPSSVTWFMQGSTAGTMITTFGLNGDRPVPNAYVP